MVFNLHPLLGEKFSIPVDKIAEEGDSDTEVDEAVFADLSTSEGICFVIKDSHNNGMLRMVRFYISWTAVLISRCVP